MPYPRSSAFIGGPSRFWEFWSIVSPDDILDLPALSISQRHGFPENRVLDQWAQRAANHQLYAPSQELLEVSDQASRKPPGCRTGNVDKEVHIAFQHCFPASPRAQNPAMRPGTHGVVAPVTSTRRSTSLSSMSSPRATEPKSRTLPAPWRAATRRISSRRSLTR